MTIVGTSFVEPLIVTLQTDQVEGEVSILSSTSTSLIIEISNGAGSGHTVTVFSGVDSCLQVVNATWSYHTFFCFLFLYFFLGELILNHLRYEKPTVTYMTVLPISGGPINVSNLLEYLIQKQLIKRR